MQHLIIYLLAVYGFSYLIVDSSIVSKLRKLWVKVPFFRDQLSCGFCTTLAYGGVLFYYVANYVAWGDWIMHPFAAAGFVSIVNRFLDPPMYDIGGAAGCSGCEDKAKYYMSKSASNRVRDYLDGK